MKASSVGFRHGLAMVARPRTSRVVASTMAVVLFATLVAASSSFAATTAASSRASTMTSSSAAIVGTTAPKYYLQKAGTGNKVLSSVALPSKWYLLWTFNCGAKRGTFKLTSTKKGQPLLAVTDQTGLGGGGQRPFTKSGTYRFAMRTTCSWKVTVASKPPSAAKSTTTTTAPKK